MAASGWIATQTITHAITQEAQVSSPNNLIKYKPKHYGPNSKV